MARPKRRWRPWYASALGFACRLRAAPIGGVVVSHGGLRSVVEDVHGRSPWLEAALSTLGREYLPKEPHAPSLHPFPARCPGAFSERTFGRYDRPMTNPSVQRLLDTSVEYVTGRRSFERAIASARAEGMSDEDIAHATGFIVGMLREICRP